MKALRIWDKIGIYMLTLIAFLFFWILLGPRFVTSFNILNVLTQVSINAIGSMGILFIITSGNVDMSIGSIYALTTIVFGLCITRLSLGVLPTILVALAVGALCGMSNGFIVTKMKLPPFIATLATKLAILGVSYVISSGKDISYLNHPEFKAIASTKILGMNSSIWLMFLVLLIACFLYKNMRFGVYVRATGTNQAITKTAGISTDKVILLCYVVSALFAVIGGSITASRTLTGSSIAGSTYTIDCICAAVLGGTSMKGGKSNPPGVFFAALLLGFVQNALDMLNLPFYYQYIVSGSVMVFALVMGNLRSLILESRI